MSELCAFDDCNRDAKIFMGNNLNTGRIPLCKQCNKLFQRHLEAREKLFANEVKEE